MMPYTAVTNCTIPGTVSNVPPQEWNEKTLQPCSQSLSSGQSLTLQKALPSEQRIWGFGYPLSTENCPDVTTVFFGAQIPKKAPLYDQPLLGFWDFDGSDRQNVKIRWRGPDELNGLIQFAFK